MILFPQVAEQVSSYLSGKSDLDSLEGWIVVNGWNMHQDSNSAVQRLVGSIELLLIEYGMDEIGETTLREKLRSALGLFSMDNSG